MQSDGRSLPRTSASTHEENVYPATSGRRTTQGADGKWMLKLVYPNAANLQNYLQGWLLDLEATAAPGSFSARVLEHHGGPSAYLIRPDDGDELQEVRGLPAVVSVCGKQLGNCAQHANVGARVHIGSPANDERMKLSSTRRVSHRSWVLMRRGAHSRSLPLLQDIAHMSTRPCGFQHVASAPTMPFAIGRC